ncbi:MAG: type IV secretion protein Rhs, partial [Bacteroidetes bacterium HGW-Bacteroidetes-1]
MIAHHTHTVNFSLGSITAISDATGNLVESLSYDPWGRRRNPSNWNDYNVTSTMFDRGFTGHEHLPQFGLINLSGRVYDSFLVRFLSPDPYVQAPDYSQNFNRYSYAFNNPLKYSDPDGEWVHLVVGAAIGGVFNWLSNGAQFNAKGLGYFGVGALAG